MSTNYYLKLGLCPCCGSAREIMHIGLGAYGWCFSLHVEPKLAAFPKNLNDWVELFKLKESVIVDEYGEIISADEMLEIIMQRSHPKEPVENSFLRNHAELGPNNLFRHKVDGLHCIAHGDGTYDLIIGEFS